MANPVEQAAKLGIAYKIPITAAIRQVGCDAVYAEFAGVQGKHALYLGECSCRHRYEIKVLLKKAQAQQQLTIQNGDIGVGKSRGFQLKDLGEY